MKVLKSPVILILSIILGIVAGIYFPAAAPALKPLSTIYLSLLQMCVIPIVVSAVTINVGTLLQKENKRVFVKWITAVLTVFLIATSVCVSIGFLVADFISPGEEIKVLISDSGQAGEIDESKYVTNIEFYDNNAVEEDTKYSLVSFLVSSIPSNIFSALSLGNMLMILFFFGVFGIMLTRIEPEFAAPFYKMFEGLSSAFNQLVNYILIPLPFAMFCVFTVQFSEEGMLEIVVSLLKLVIVIVASLMVLCSMFFLIIQRSTKCTGREHFLAVKRVLFITLGTSNCMATVAVAIEDSIQHLKLDKKITNAIMPIGITMCQSGVAGCTTIAAVFATTIYDVQIDLNSVMIIMVGAVMFSLSIIGVPGLVAVSMLSIVMTPLGMPSDLIILVYLAIIPIIDPFAIFTGVYGNFAIAAVTSGKIKEGQNEGGYR